MLSGQLGHAGTAQLAVAEIRVMLSNPGLDRSRHRSVSACWRQADQSTRIRGACERRRTNARRDTLRLRRGLRYARDFALHFSISAARADPRAALLRFSGGAQCLALPQFFSPG